MDYLIFCACLGLLFAVGLYLNRYRQHPATGDSHPELKVNVSLSRVACAGQRDYLCAQVSLHDSSTDRLWLRDVSVRLMPIAGNTLPVEQHMALDTYHLDHEHAALLGGPQLVALQQAEPVLTLIAGDQALFAHPLSLQSDQPVLVEVMVMGVALLTGQSARWTSALMLAPDSARPALLRPFAGRGKRVAQALF